ncbi:MAG: cell division topological specificity factor MinE [Anaerovibrio sp.]|nr:cell division topological specificity factor MinE [Selenomonadaceae bacterium]MDD6397027.1 cell division topological specificity factor MinE [Selenomonadaceae bacterium]MDY6053506.1 cell division topological specificity factor MinE [Anaerovibrio sp.]
MLDSLLKIFSKEKSGKVAKRRLQMVLIQDRASVSPEMMNQLRDDIIQVISKYMVINQSDMEITLENVDDSVALVANIPVQNMKHH